MSPSSLLSIINQTKLKFVLFLLLIGTLPLTIPFILFYVIRRIAVQTAAKLIRKDLSNILTPLGTVFAADDFFIAPKNNIIASIIMQGKVDTEKVKQKILSHLLDSPEASKNYPELKQYLVEWGGYWFWKSDKSFNINNHFKVIDDGKSYTLEDVKSLSQDRLRKKWDRNSPLWEFTVVQNFVSLENPNSGSKSVLIWRSHHALGAGYSLVHLLIEKLGESKYIFPTPNKIQSHPLSNIVSKIIFPIKLLWELTEMIINSAESYSFNVSSSDSTRAQLITDSSSLIPISKVKDVKNHFKTSFTSVQFAALAGAVRDYNLKRKMPLPLTYPCITFLPYLSHEVNRLRNHTRATSAYLPTLESDPYRRLLFCQNDFLRIKSSPFAAASFFSFSFLGCCTRNIIRAFLNHHCFPIGISNFPAGAFQFTILGHQAIDYFTFLGLQEGKSGVSFTLISFAEGFKISGTARSTIMTKEDLSEMINLFVQHIENLHQLAILDKRRINET